MNILLKLLNLLPFNGSKTGLGILLIIFSALQNIDPAAIDQLKELLHASPVNWVAVSILVIGIIHKLLKGYAGGAETTEKKWGGS